MKHFSPTDLEQLYQMCRQESVGGAVSLTLDQLFLHPASRERAQAACRVVTRRFARDRELCDDVLHDATVSLGRRLALGRLKVSPVDCEALGGWLWSIWYRACLNARRRYRRNQLQEFQLSDLQRTELVPEPHCDDALWKQVESALEQIGDPLLRAILQDLAAGLNVRESATRRAISKSKVARLRVIGLEEIRTELKKNESPDTATR